MALEAHRQVQPFSRTEGCLYNQGKKYSQTAGRVNDGLPSPAIGQYPSVPCSASRILPRSLTSRTGGSMVEVPITIACGNYDRTAAIRDGRVKVDGCAVTYLPLYPEEIFHRAFKFDEFDVSELSFSSYLRTTVAGTSPYIGIPAFVSRIFRHSGIYIRTDSGIRKPEDLRGKRIGLPEYQITAVVWMRGMLQHEYGVSPTEIHWRNGGQEEPGRGERTALKPIPGLDLEPLGPNETLVAMLRDGDLDALFTARAPSSFLNGEPHIARLFPDTREAEKAYYKKTGLFPI